MGTTRQQALSPGTIVETFEIMSVLGTGGFGVTYRAHDQQLDCSVAIKEYFPAGLAARDDDATTIIPRTESQTKAFGYGLKRFLAEAQTLAKFHEPSIVRVNRYLESNGTAYFVMDYEEGKSLSEVLHRLRVLKEQQAKAVLVHILRGLRAVHEKKFLHRDIKPANILIRKSGPPVLLDFGAARLALEERQGSMTVMLTPGYAPIEQYSGEEKQGAWSDIYALGGTIYHCVSGVAPVSATERLGVIHQGRTDPVNDGLEALVGRFSREFLDVIRWMLEPYAPDRPRDGGEVLDVLLGGANAGRPGSAAGSNSTELRQGLTGLGAPTVLNPGLAAPGDPRSRSHPPHGGRSNPATGGTTLGSAAIDENVMEEVQARLAGYIGPIARVLVANAAAHTSNRRELVQALAEELDDEAERRAFLSGPG